MVLKRFPQSEQFCSSRRFDYRKKHHHQLSAIFSKATPAPPVFAWARTSRSARATIHRRVRHGRGIIRHYRHVSLRASLYIAVDVGGWWDSGFGGP